MDVIEADKTIGLEGRYIACNILAGNGPEFRSQVQVRPKSLSQIGSVPSLLHNLPPRQFLAHSTYTNASTSASPSSPPLVLFLDISRFAASPQHGFAHHRIEALSSPLSQLRDPLSALIPLSSVLFSPPSYTTILALDTFRDILQHSFTGHLSIQTRPVTLRATCKSCQIAAQSILSLLPPSR
ncbi:hypothetical protein BDZ85DRAFT_253651 [Elsinoe ampelina]|uniref:Uncharacterized protein n=1 Tax=Elsinoe ampelina TaxID=302913 RepID=A0A6A6FXX4_9PEZI|nr:hypothetical protein BDZ85DRAFT_253651 [Elsinoe ampelina]